MRQYTDEQKAHVIAEWELGASVKGLAAKHGVPRSTVTRWTSGSGRTLAVTQIDHREELGRLVYEYLAAGLKALVAQAGVMGDPEWFKGQGDSAHLIHGVLADKLVIIFGGVERGSGKPDDPNPG